MQHCNLIVTLTLFAIQQTATNQAGSKSLPYHFTLMELEWWCRGYHWSPKSKSSRAWIKWVAWPCRPHREHSTLNVQTHTQIHHIMSVLLLKWISLHNAVLYSQWNVTFCHPPSPPSHSSVKAFNYFHFLKTISSIKAGGQLSGGQKCPTYPSHGGDYCVHHWGEIAGYDKVLWIMCVLSLQAVQCYYWLSHLQTRTVDRPFQRFYWHSN